MSEQVKKPKIDLKSIFRTMIQIGLIGFGGGNALIPVIEQSAVYEKELVTKDEYDEDVLIASITPGALPVEIAAGIGKRIAGWRGTLVSAVAMASPGVVLTLLLLTWTSMLSGCFVRQIDYISVGVSGYIICMLTEYIIDTLRKCETTKSCIQSLIIIFVIGTLTGGQKLFKLLNIDVNFPIHLSSIQIFIIFFILALCVGVRQNKGDFTANIKTAFNKIDSRNSFKEIKILALLVVIVTIISSCVTVKSIEFAGKGLLSSIMSFGGGDAYITIADGLFVQEDLVSESEFYGSLVPIVNILPGSILCKTLSGVGYYIGYNATGSIWGGYIVALLGFTCSIAASCGVFLIVSDIYNCISKLEVFNVLKKWMRTVVSGLLLSVMIALANQSINGVGNDISKMGLATILIMSYIMCLSLMYCKKGRSKSLVLSILTAVVSCNVLAIQ